MRGAHKIWKIQLGCAVALVAAVSLAPFAEAQNSSPQIRALAAPYPPFVMERKGALAGFSIDVWNAIAARLKLDTSYQIVPDAQALEAAMRSGQSDLIVSPVIITAARDADFDFSYPIVEAGLQIMVRETGGAGGTVAPWQGLLQLLFSPMIFVWLGIALLMVLIPAHIIWLLERRRDSGVIESKKYFPGIFQAMAWAASALVSQVQGFPAHWLARIFALLWMFAGVVFVAFYTAQLTTTLTVRQIKGTINGPEDLPGKQVATIANSNAAEYLLAHNVQVRGFPTLDQSYQALLDKRVDAVVFNAPALLYYAAHEGDGLVKVVGPEFNVSPLAFTFQLNSPLRRKVNGALLALRENGTYEQLYKKWFGTAP